MKSRRGEGGVCDKYIYFSALSAHRLCMEIGLLPCAPMCLVALSAVA